MGRGFEITGGSLSLFLYASQLVALLSALLFVAFSSDGSASSVVAILFASLVITTAVGLWRAKTGKGGGTHLGTVADITYDPFADPGQAAKDRWEKGVRRLPGRDDERD